MTQAVQTEKSATPTVPPPELPSDDGQEISSLLAIRLLINIPLVKAVIQKSESAWRTVKGESSAAKWTLNAVELIAGIAAKSGRILGWFFRVPIDIADRALSGRIIEAERSWPILKEPPNKVVEVIMEAVKPRLGSWYAALGVVAADGKRAVSALADLSRKMVDAVRTSTQQALTNFEDLVDEIIARAVGETRIVEGKSGGSSEASATVTVRAAGSGLVGRAVQSLLYLSVGVLLICLSAVPGLRHVAKGLREHTGPQQGEAVTRGSSRASPTPGVSTSTSSSGQSATQGSSRASPTPGVSTSSSGTSSRSHAADVE